jgi:phenylalanyl-tRNA synthetase beta chain
MRVPVQWLHDYCRPDLDTHELADRLSMTGTEVERVERHGVAALEKFVAAKVLDAHPHPDADRLRVCVVDAGESEPRQIVCGATNVAAGQTVAVAKPGAVMPDGTTLRKAKLRGLESDGMILAEDELAIGTEHAGILVLDSPDSHETGNGIKPGTPLEEIFPLATDVLVLEITPNRPDCLAIYGVAREVHAATGAPLAPPPWVSDPGAAGEIRDEQITITVEAPELCPRFTARAFDQVRIKPSPPWLKARLMAAGQRPISNVVDITNYVMLLTGQPMHAFDLDRIAGRRLIVRTAREGETIETLDGQRRALDPSMVLIEDEQGPTSIAGIMGGARSEVSDQTGRVLMEAANWIGANIHRTSLALGLRSEASTRFEKQLQPEQAMEAQAIATRLMIELADAHVIPGTVDIGGPGPAPQSIHLRDARLAGLLGTEIPRARSRRILEALQFTTADAQGGLDVTPPTFRRADVTREADVIEEVARLDGLEKLPASLPSRHGAYGQLTERQRQRRAAADALTAQGLYEIVGWSFVAPDLAQRLRLAPRPVVALANPMSAEQSELRTTLLGSLLDVARSNRSRGATTVRLFEAGAVYLPTTSAELGDHGPTLPREPYHISALLVGPSRPPTWRDPNPSGADFFAAKGVLSGLLTALRIPHEVRGQPQPEPFLHPGRASTIRVAGESVGWLGELHPLVAAHWDLDGTTVAGFELDLDAAAQYAVATTVYVDLTSFPAVLEDLAVIVADTITAADVLNTVRAAGAPLLQSAEVFDVYRDPQRIGAGNVSLALRLTFRATDRTLTDEEVAGRREAISRALENELGGRIRAA